MVSCVEVPIPKYPVIPELLRPSLKTIPKSALNGLEEAIINDLLYNDHALKNWGAKMDAMIRAYNNWRKEQELDLSSR